MSALSTIIDQLQLTDADERIRHYRLAVDPMVAKLNIERW